MARMVKLLLVRLGELGKKEEIGEGDRLSRVP